MPDPKACHHPSPRHVTLFATPNPRPGNSLSGHAAEDELAAVGAAPEQGLAALGVARRQHAVLQQQKGRKCRWARLAGENSWG